MLKSGKMGSRPDTIILVDQDRITIQNYVQNAFEENDQDFGTTFYAVLSTLEDSIPDPLLEISFLIYYSAVQIDPQIKINEAHEIYTENEAGTNITTYKKSYKNWLSRIQKAPVNVPEVKKQEVKPEVKQEVKQEAKQEVKVQIQPIVQPRVISQPTQQVVTVKPIVTVKPTVIQPETKLQEAKLPEAKLQEVKVVELNTEITESDLEPNEYDTNITKLYKQAYLFDIPPEYIIQSGTEFVPIPDLIREYISKNTPLQDIVEQIQKLNPIDTKKILVYWYTILKGEYTDQINSNIADFSQIFSLPFPKKIISFVLYDLFLQNSENTAESAFNFVNQNQFQNLEDFLSQKEQDIKIYLDLYTNKDQLYQDLLYIIDPVNDIAHIIHRIHGLFKTLTKSEVPFIVYDLLNLVPIETVVSIMNASSIAHIGPIDSIAIFNAVNLSVSSVDRWQDYFSFDLARKNSLYILNTIFNHHESFETADQFNQYLSDFETINETEVTANAIRVKQVIFSQRQLLKLSSLEYSPSEIISKRIQLNPTLKTMNRIPVPEDGVQIFDSAVASSFIPLIIYIDDNGNKKIKVYSGNVIDLQNNFVADKPNYDFINQFDYHITKNNHIYSVYWFEQKHKLNKTSYQLLDYDLNINTMEIEIFTETEKIIEPILEQSFSNLSFNFSEQATIQFSGSFNIYGIELEYSSFTSILSLNPLFRTYFYLNEDRSIAASKRNWKLYFRAYSFETEDLQRSNINFILRPEKARFGDVMNVIQGNQTVQRTIYTETPYLSISVSKVKTESDKLVFIGILRKLLHYYNEIKNQLQQYLSSHLFSENTLGNLDLENKSESRRSSVSTEASSILSARSASKIAALKQFHPIFDPPYARDGCQKKFQPTIVPDNQVEAWTNQTAIDKRGTVINRPVVQFTAPAAISSKGKRKYPETTFYFGCDNDIHVYPYLKPNNMGNLNLYPVVPCCKDLPETVEVKTRERRREQTKMLVNTSTGISYESIANLPNPLVNLLQRYSVNSGNFNRYGTLIGVNTFLHAIYYAISDPLYTQSKTATEKETYVRNSRSKLIHQIESLNLCKQELYDKSLEYIRDELANPAKTLYSNEYVRILEEIFNLNIYVLSSEVNLKFELSRSKYLSIRSFKDVPERKTLVLFEIYEPYQLCVIFETQDKVKIKLFNQQMNALLYTTMTATNQNLVLTENGIYKNFLNLINYSQLGTLYAGQIGNPISQILDSAGKLRAINILIKPNQRISLLIPASEPLNLPIENQIYPARLELVRTLINAEPKSIISLDQNTKVYGLWYDLLGYQDAILIPVILDTQINLPIGPVNSLFRSLSSDQDLLLQYRMVERSMNLSFGLIKWSYILGKAFQKINLDEFSKYLVLIPTSQTLDSTLYNYDNLTEALPNLSSLQDALKYIRVATNNTLSTGTNFRIKNQEIKNRILQKLRIYDRYTDGLLYDIPETRNLNRHIIVEQLLKIPTKLDGYYKYIQDFRQYQNNLIFLSDLEYKSWLVNLDQKLKIYDRPSLELQNLEIPYLFRDEIDNLFLVQNCNSLDTAIYISEYYRVNQINLGYNSNSTSVDIQNMPYVLFGISAGKLVVIKMNDGADPTLIIKYSDQKYAAILRI